MIVALLPSGFICRMACHLLRRVQPALPGGCAASRSSGCVRHQADRDNRQRRPTRPHSGPKHLWAGSAPSVKREIP